MSLKHKIKKLIPVSGVLVLTLFLFLGCSSKPKESDEVNEKDIGLGDVELSNLAGEKIDMAQFENKIVFINFWATWCKPCIQEMPAIARAREIIKDEHVVFLLASSEGIDQIKKFKDKKDFPFQYVQLRNMEELNIQAIPATFIFDPEGQLIFSEVGYRNWDTPENIALITNKPSTL
jgi:thiol-disulfide isomerase/thioredoxin